MWLSTLSDEQRNALFRLAHNVIVSDGILDPNEEGMMADFRREMEISSHLDPEYLALDGIDTVFPDREARIVVLLNLLKISYADGAFDIEEECLLNEIRPAFECSDDEFRLLDNWVRRLHALEREADDIIHGLV